MVTTLRLDAILDIISARAFHNLGMDTSELSNLLSDVRLFIPREPSGLVQVPPAVYVKHGTTIDANVAEFLERYQSEAAQIYPQVLLEFEPALKNRTPVMQKQLLDKVRYISDLWMFQRGRGLIPITNSIELALTERSESVEVYVRLGTKVTPEQIHALNEYRRHAVSLYKIMMYNVAHGMTPKFIVPMTQPYTISEAPI